MTKNKVAVTNYLYYITEILMCSVCAVRVVGPGPVG